MNNFENLIPLPSSITPMKGITFVTPNGITPLVYAPSFFYDELVFVCHHLSEAGFKCAPAPKDTDPDNLPPNCVIQVEEEPDLPMAEMYQLRVTSSFIQIRASDSSGAFYAFETLRQLALSSRKGRLPGISIIDNPATSWRGLMLDTSRHFFPVSFIKKILDTMAFHKLNRFHWHLTDDQGWRLYIPSLPELTEKGGWRHDTKTTWEDVKIGGFYTEEDITEVVKYATERHIIVIPEIDVPGHASAILTAYPELGCTGGPYEVEDRFGIFKEVLCAGNDRVFDVLKTIFEQVCKVFPGPYIHIGGDECPKERWDNCPKCKKRMKDEHIASSTQLQAWFTSKVANIVQSLGKTPIGWDEVLDGTEVFGLPENMIVQSWQSSERGVIAAKRGLQTIMSPMTDGCYLDYSPINDPAEPGRLGLCTVKNSYDYTPIPSSFDSKMSEKVLGGQANFWTEGTPYSRVVEYLLFPRLCAISESLWLPSYQKDFASFAKRLPAHKKRLKKLDILFYDGPLE